MFRALKDQTPKEAVNEDLILDLEDLIKVEKEPEQILMRKNQNTVKLLKIKLRSTTRINLRFQNSI